MSGDENAPVVTPTSYATRQRRDSRVASRDGRPLIAWVVMALVVLAVLYVVLRVVTFLVAVAAVVVVVLAAILYFRQYRGRR